MPRTSGLRRAVAPGADRRGEPPAGEGGVIMPDPDHLDRLIHERLRLGIVTALTANESLSFTDLKRLLKTTDGNLSVHASRLEDAGYVSVTKRVDGRSSRTEFRLTPAGRAALLRYLDYMDALVEAVRRGIREQGKSGE